MVYKTPIEWGEKGAPQFAQRRGHCTEAEGGEVPRHVALACGYRTHMQQASALFLCCTPNHRLTHALPKKINLGR